MVIEEGFFEYNYFVWTIQKKTVNQHVRRKLKQLGKDLRNSDQSTSDNDSTLSEPESDGDDKTYKPGRERRYIKVVVNPKLWKKEYRKNKKLYMDVKLEDHPDKWERKLFTSTLRQERNIAVESKSYEEYRCLLCTGHHAFHTSAADLMESHLEEHLNSNFPCRECDATFDLQSLLTEHCNKEHSVTCEICDQEFSSRGLYKRHIGRMHGQRSISCFKCDEKFKTKLLFKQHLLEAHPGSAHRCDKCGVILRSHLNAMQGHMNSKNCLRRQQGNLKTQCEICGKLVSENGIRKHRQRVHQKLRIFKCDVCPYAGITLQSLKDHKKTHTGEHPVKCTLCEFSCIKPYQLKCHMRTHLKLKPYKCDKCSYAASWNVQVKDHMKAHFSPTRVDCADCNISFKDQRGLNLHRHKEHREGAKDDKAKELAPKKRGRPTRVMEGEVKPDNKRGTRKKKTEQEWSEEEEDSTDTEAELQNEASEEEKYIPRKSARRRVTKRLDPQFEHSSEGEEEEEEEEAAEEEENDGHEQAADSYVPSVSKIVQ
ncbi:transcriptional repressor CTCF-like [Mizuhopecten yessoensis]|uniref:transcriptional repressor CTCF-like n=1 Tax=Mizuhopecten yessoensis TaxID=6573 RepID=UPI000B45E3EB|nr:transcriptional repressor CTCF-like [Mizuhopecten yessoensis]